MSSLISKYTLNSGQADALRSVADMFQCTTSNNTAAAGTPKPLCLIKGLCVQVKIQGMIIVLNILLKLAQQGISCSL